jgi:hypothetical protein
MKRIVIVLIALAVGSNLFAQDFGFGLRLGGNFSQIDGDMASGYNKIGYHVGILTSYPFSSISSGNLEIAYSSKGARYSEIGQVTVLDYVEISLLYGLRISKKIEILAGVQPSVLTNHNVTQDGVDAGAVFNFNKLDIPVAVGLRLYLNEHIAIEGRLSYSLTNINGNGAYGTKGLFGNYGQFNNVLSGSLIYKL